MDKGHKAMAISYGNTETKGMHPKQVATSNNEWTGAH